MPRCSVLVDVFSRSSRNFSRHSLVSQHQSKKKFSEKTALGRRLREVREEAGLTLAAFGKLVGCDRSYISQLENAKGAVPSDTFLLAVQAVFGVRREWLRTGQEPRNAAVIYEDWGKVKAPALALELDRRLGPLRAMVQQLNAYIEALDKEIKELHEAKGFTFSFGGVADNPRLSPGGDPAAASLQPGAATPQQPGGSEAAVTPAQPGGDPAATEPPASGQKS